MGHTFGLGVLGALWESWFQWASDDINYELCDRSAYTPAISDAGAVASAHANFT